MEGRQLGGKRIGGRHAEPVVPAISGDGERIAFVSTEAETGDAGGGTWTRLVLVEPKDGGYVAARVLVEARLRDGGFSGPFRLGRGGFSGDGSRLVFSAGQALVPEYDNTVRDVYMVEVDGDEAVSGQP